MCRPHARLMHGTALIARVSEVEIHLQERVAELGCDDPLRRSVWLSLIRMAPGTLKGLTQPDPAGDFPGDISGRLCCFWA